MTAFLQKFRFGSILFNPRFEQNNRMFRSENLLLIFGKLSLKNLAISWCVLLHFKRSLTTFSCASRTSIFTETNSNTACKTTRVFGGEGVVAKWNCRNWTTSFFYVYSLTRNTRNLQEYQVSIF